MSIEHGTYVDKMKIFQEIAFCDQWDWELRNQIKDFIESLECVNLLDRDTGKEPILESGSSLVHESRTDGTSGYTTRRWEEWTCPVCGWFVGELYSGHGAWHIQGERSYCAQCGQKIDWTLPKAEEKRRYEERKAKERAEWERKNGCKYDNMNIGKRIRYGITKKEDVDGEQ